MDNKSTEELEEDISLEGHKLMAMLMQRNYSTYADMSESLINSLTKENEYVSATLALVRLRIEQLYNDRYLPHPDVVLSALNPTRQDVLDFIESGNEDG